MNTAYNVYNLVYLLFLFLETNTLGLLTEMRYKGRKQELVLKRNNL